MPDRSLAPHTHSVPMHTWLRTNLLTRTCVFNSRPNPRQTALSEMSCKANRAPCLFRVQLLINIY